MMDDVAALKLANDLVRMPSRVRGCRSEPLPAGVSLLLRIAAGDSDAEARAVELTGRPPADNREAAAFFIEQILLDPDADSYRVLGASISASGADLRRNMALILRWLHPDLDPKGERSMFAKRVTGAWDNLKTPERRASYDKLLNTQQVAARTHRDQARSKSRNQRNLAVNARFRMLRSEALRRSAHGANWPTGFWLRSLFFLFRRRRK